MGLLYPFPVSSEETDFVQLQLSPQGRVSQVRVKSYGLPYIFWGYALASFTVLFFLWLAVRDPMEKLARLGGTDAWLVGSLQLFMLLLPIVVLGFFFYQKTLETSGRQLKMVHSIFFCPIKTRLFHLAPDAFAIAHHMDAPNVARLKGGPEAQGFQNKGYFTLWVKTTDEKLWPIDRHSRKKDLEALVTVLSLSLD